MGVLAADVGPQAHHHGLAHHQAARHFDVAAHGLEVHLQAFEHRAAVLQCAGHQTEGLGQNDPFDFPRPRAAFVVGHHGVHQRRDVLAHNADGGVDVAAGDGVALLRHGAAAAGSVVVGLEDLGHFGLHHQFHVHAEHAQRAADQPQHGGHFGDVVADGVPGNHRLLQPQLGTQPRLHFIAPVSSGGLDLPCSGCCPGCLGDEKWRL